MRGGGGGGGGREREREKKTYGERPIAYHNKLVSLCLKVGFQQFRFTSLWRGKGVAAV